MSIRYYTDKSEVVSSNLFDFGILPTIRHFIHSQLYPDDSPASFSLDMTDYPKFRLADIDAQSAFKEQQTSMAVQNEILPFTAYNIGEWVEDDEKKNHNAKSFHYYSEEYGCYISARPLQLEVPMISFFSTTSDYYHARSLLHDINMSYTQLYAPIQLNSIDTQVPFSLSMEISKGTYTHEFEEQLNSGSISDVVHSMVVSFWDITLDTDNVYPVESFGFDIYSYEGDINTGVLKESICYTSYPEVDSVVPVNESEDISIDSTIAITFSEAMYVTTVEDGISVLPYFDYDLTYNEDETIFTITPTDSLANSSTYTITIDETAKGASTQELNEDYSFSFTTED